MSERGERQPEMYSSLAGWFHLVTSPGDSDYADEAAFVIAALREHCDGPVTALLELGSGGGNLASHLKEHANVTLTDLSPDMLALSRTLNPTCEHVEGDMRTMRLGHEFDGVVVHDAVMYMTDEADLGAAIATAYTHTRPGGAAVFLPDCVRETYAPGTDHGGYDGDGRSLRYLEWTWDPDPSDSTFVTDYAYLLREGDAAPRAIPDRHVLGLFSREAWSGFLEGVGFVPYRIVDPWERDVFVGVRAPSRVAP